jgi:hypothetical protein
MIRKITLLFLACFGLIASANAQTCGFDKIQKERLATDPNYAAELAQSKLAWQQWYLSKQNAPVGLLIPLPGGDSVYEIPVVVHVLHTGGAVGSIYNPTDAQIQSTIDYVNKAYEAAWPSYPNPSTGGTKIRLRFALAKRDESCNSATGIVRVNAVSALGGTTGTTYNDFGVRGSGVTNTQLKNISKWNNRLYYNIWIVNKIEGKDGTSGSFVAGYATLPTSANLSNEDGTVMLATQFQPGKITLVHELGHALGLEHVFDGYNETTTPPTCPPNANCLVDNDGICDTEPTIPTVGSCPTGINTCTGLPYNNEQKNFMNYSNCQDRFTPGQRDKIMFTFFHYRGSLITSLGATAPPTFVTPACTPATTNPFNLNSGPNRVFVYQNTTAFDTAFRMDVRSQGYSGDGSIAYVDNTCKHLLELKAGQQYKLLIGTATTTQSERVRVWIDYNNNGDFTDPGETIASGNSGLVGGGGIYNAIFTVPTTGIAGCTQLRMRVMSDRVSAPTFTPCSSLQFGQAEDYTVLISGGGSGGSSNAGPGNVTLTKPPTGGNPSCIGTELSFTANPAPSRTPVWFGWYRKSGVVVNPGPECSNCSTWTSTIFNNNDTVYARMAFTSSCGVDTAYSDTIVVQRRVTIPPSVEVGLVGGTNPGCIDDTMYFEAVNLVNTGANPTFQWYITNGSGTNPIPGATSKSYKAVFLNNGDQLSVQMTSSAPPPCALPATVMSPPVTINYITKPATIRIDLTSGANPGCSNQTLTFTATTTVEGTNPSYNWTVNGNPQFVNSRQFSGTFNHNDIIQCTLTSSSACASPAVVSSNTIQVIHQQIIASVNIYVVGGTDVACKDKYVTFRADGTNTGANPQYEWKLNGTVVANGPNYSTNTLNNGDVIFCTLTATDPCVANPVVVSNEITMTIKPTLRPKASILVTSGRNPGCLDSLVEMTAFVKDLGPNPNYDWFVNDLHTFNGKVFLNTAFKNGDKVVLRANQTDNECYIPDTVTAEMIMVRSTTPEPPVISLIGNKLITNKAGAFVWFGPTGQQEGGTDGIYHPTIKGTYFAVTDNNGCWSIPSNLLIITLLDVKTASLSSAVKIYPNPTTGQLTFDWDGKKVNMTIDVFNSIGQQVKHEQVIDESTKVINLSNLANGMYHILMTDEQGNTGTARITLAK